MITKTAKDIRNGTLPTFFYDAARDGMSDFLDHFKPQKRLRILLPDWIGWSVREGSGVMDPVYERGAEFAFYAVTECLTVDFDDLQRQLRSDSFDLVLVIHYFGRTEPKLAEVASAVDAHGAVLIEDLAHAFLSQSQGSTAGSKGSLSLYALHKLLPMPSGGMARYSDPRLVTGQASRNAQVASDFLQYDLAEISRARRKTYDALLEELATLPNFDSLCRPLWPELGPTDVPQTLPLILETGNRDQVYQRMNESGVGAVSLYHTLIKELQGSGRLSEELSKKIINLPVHQDVSPSGVRTIVSVFRSALQESS